MIKSLLDTNFKRGVALPIVILIVFSFMSIIVSVSRLSFLNVQLAQSSQQSSYALYAADAGLECVLYQDLNQNAFFDNAGTNITGVNCGGVSTFDFAYEQNNCAKVRDVDSGVDWCYKAEFEIDTGSATNYQVEAVYGADTDPGGGLQGEIHIVTTGYNTVGDNRQLQRQIYYYYDY